MAFIVPRYEHVVFMCESRLCICRIDSDSKIPDTCFVDCPKPIKSSSRTDSKVQDPEGSEKKRAFTVKQEKSKIVCGTFSPCGKYFAVADDNKQLIVWQIGGDHKWNLFNTRYLVRKAVHLVFSPQSDDILVADRTGDVYKFSLSNPLHEGILVLGHLSILLDMVITPDGRFIITCDRDEKIRVTSYPNAYNIHTYCLGHTEFVTSLAILPSHTQFLVSASGDKTLRLWRYIDGEEVFQLDYTDGISHLLLSDKNNDQQSVDGDDKNRHEGVVRQLQSDSGEKPGSVVRSIQCLKHSTGDQIIALLDGIPGVAVYQVNVEVLTESISCQFTQLITCTAEPWDCCIDDNNFLWLLVPQEGQTVRIFESKGKQIQEVTKESQPRYFHITEIMNKQWEFFEAASSVRTNYQFLYKQWYDNMEEYKRKKEYRLLQKGQQEDKQCKMIKTK
ncbi:tRNA (guanine-N(7)-)-methyltransferase non-catalytic subunit wdr4-like [Limulus polyphemus]|uniref:tRNA (guanine-N(7)-)-methyltransferase non-catalytic subunit n=1 Tax=Limulus polyphemus TaxID=6850 RepID=A0ABM1BF41_LIMPO|nr:tRNA (guanine-N(7)-)-methyltransferase non-catalytic subunit wdr4-like [Limulus polyphemus]